MANKDDKKERMPVLFIGHGSPMNAIANNDYTRALNGLSKKFKTPKAIVMVSAHWETKGTWVTGMKSPRTIHDFYGFPKDLYSIQYNAPGEPKLANELADLHSFSIDNEKWGLDHGTWSILKHIYPDAQVPVIQISLDMTKPAAFHYELGKKLQALRNQGVLIMGSGNIVHNLRKISWDEKAPISDWANDFNNWVKEKLSKKDFNALTHDFLKSKAGRESVPTVEHYLPLLYIIGATDEKDKLSIDYDDIQNGSISMLSIRFSS